MYTKTKAKGHCSFYAPLQFWGFQGAVLGIDSKVEGALHPIPWSLIENERSAPLVQSGAAPFFGRSTPSPLIGPAPFLGRSTPSPLIGPAPFLGRSCSFWPQWNYSFPWKERSFPPSFPAQWSCSFPWKELFLSTTVELLLPMEGVLLPTTVEFLASKHACNGPILAYLQHIKLIPDIGLQYWTIISPLLLFSCTSRCPNYYWQLPLYDRWCITSCGLWADAGPLLVCSLWYQVSLSATMTNVFHQISFVY